MTRDELVALATRLDTADGTEEELDDIMDRLEDALPHGDIITLLYHTRPELTAEEAIDEALRREAAYKA